MVYPVQLTFGSFHLPVHLVCEVLAYSLGYRFYTALRARTPTPSATRAGNGYSWARRATEAELLAFTEANIPERAAVSKNVYIAAELPLTAIGKILKPTLVKQEISRVYTRELAAVLGLTVQAETVRDDKKLGLVAEISASGVVDEAAIAQALLGLAVPYEVKQLSQKRP